MYINITISGVTPLILNRFHDEAALAASSGRRTTKQAPSESPQEMCQKKLYLSEEGIVGIPTMNLLASIRDAGKYFKAGKRQLSTADSSMIPAFVLPTEVFVHIVHEHPWRVDARPIVNPATKGRRLCYRPLFEDWTIKFELDFCDEEFDAKLLRQVVDAAGKRIGLGDFRPSKRGPYGRFVVQSWDERQEA
jgi:hypothetical protein